MSKLCGSSGAETKFKSTGKGITIVFHSDGAVNNTGFRIYYYSSYNTAMKDTGKLIP
jgi:hypothetical protein